MWEIYKREIRDKVKSITFWSLIWVSLSVMVILVYPVIRDNADELISLVEVLPPELFSAFGSSASALATIPGYFNSQFTVIYLFAVAIYASFWGTGLIAKGIEDRTLVFLLSKPLSRFSIGISKFMAAASGLVITNALIIVVSALCFLLVEPFSNIPFDYFAKLILVTSVWSVFILALSYLVSVTLNSMASLATVIAIAIMTFVINSIYLLEGVPELMKYMNLFYYLAIDSLGVNGQINMLYVLLILLATVVLFLLGNVYFSRRDIDI